MVFLCCFTGALISHMLTDDLNMSSVICYDETYEVRSPGSRCGFESNVFACIAGSEGTFVAGARTNRMLGCTSRCCGIVLIRRYFPGSDLRKGQVKSALPFHCLQPGLSFLQTVFQEDGDSVFACCVNVAAQTAPAMSYATT